VTESSYFVSVVVPLANDGDILAGFVDELVTVLRAEWRNHEVVLVDDGSRDSTRVVATKLLARHEGLRYLRLSKRCGPEVAILAGTDGVIGDVVVVLEPESDPPALLPKFIESARSSGGIVFGVRSRALAHGALYGLGRHFYARSTAHIFELELPAQASLYMAFTRQALNAVSQIKDKSRALRVFGAVVGFPRSFITYDPLPRRPSVRRKSVTEGLERGVSLLVTSSTRPLRYVALLGLGASLLSFAYLVYVLVVVLIRKRVAEGWVTLSVTTSAMFVVLFIILAVLAEYVGRLLEETRDRPLYFIAEERSSSVVELDQARRNVVHEST